MPLKYIGYGFGILMLLVVVGGVAYKQFSPTYKTIVGQGGRVVNISTDKPGVPIGGCSIYRLQTKLLWEKGFRVDAEKIKEAVKK